MKTSSQFQCDSRKVKKKCNYIEWDPGHAPNGIYFMVWGEKGAFYIYIVYSIPTPQPGKQCRKMGTWMMASNKPCMCT